MTIYSDEHHIDRPIFSDALLSGEISYRDLCAEARTIMIPWQLFFLDKGKLDDTIAKIDAKRKTKFNAKLLSSRDNSPAGGISLRIADRVIAFQEFAAEHVVEKNGFCGSLIDIHRDKWAEYIIKHFEIDVSTLQSGNKGRTLDKLIKRIESRHIRVARGVLDSTNMLLPVAEASRQAYRKSSGFVIKDDKVPYIFLPNEVNDSETAGRQILTLIVLVILIGNNQYNLSINGELELYIKGKKQLQQAFGVASEILLPFSATMHYTEADISLSTINDLSSKYMLTPSAIVVTLCQRGLIMGDAKKYQLLDELTQARPAEKKTPKRPAHIDNAVRKMCGDATATEIVRAIDSKSLSSIPAQYLIFGRVDKLRYAKFKATVGL